MMEWICLLLVCLIAAAVWQMIVATTHHEIHLLCDVSPEGELRAAVWNLTAELTIIPFPFSGVDLSTLDFVPRTRFVTANIPRRPTCLCVNTPIRIPGCLSFHYLTIHAHQVSLKPDNAPEIQTGYFEGIDGTRTPKIISLRPVAEIISTESDPVVHEAMRMLHDAYTQKRLK